MANLATPDSLILSDSLSLSLSNWNLSNKGIFGKPHPVRTKLTHLLLLALILPQKPLLALHSQNKPVYIPTAANYFLLLKSVAEVGGLI